MNPADLRERFAKLSAQADRDEDVGAELRALAFDLEEAAKSASTEEEEEMLARARDARSYADRLDRWHDLCRRRKQKDKTEAEA